jgi:endonuclease YncB( thermonuclease family)
VTAGEAPSSPAYVYRARVERVVDGRTLIARVDLGFRVAVSVAVRLAGIDAPGLEGGRGPEARDALAAFTAGRTLLLRSRHAGRPWECWVCDLWWEDGTSVARLVASAGFGPPEQGS